MEALKRIIPFHPIHEKVLFLTSLITVTNCLTEVAGGGRDLLWIMASVLECSVEILHILEDQMQRVYARNRTKV